MAGIYLRNTDRCTVIVPVVGVIQAAFVVIKCHLILVRAVDRIQLHILPEVFDRLLVAIVVPRIIRWFLRSPRPACKGIALRRCAVFRELNLCAAGKDDRFHRIHRHFVRNKFDRVGDHFPVCLIAAFSCRMLRYGNRLLDTFDSVSAPSDKFISAPRRCI